MRILISAVLAVGCAQPVLACDLCSVYAATEAQGGSGQGFFGGVAEQFTRFGTLQDEGQKVPNTFGQYINSSVSQVFAGYNFSDRFGLQLNLPVIYRSWKLPPGGAMGSELGIGDVSLTGNLLAYRKLAENFTFNWSVLGGLKFPTGDSSHLNDPDVEGSGIGGHDLALGSSSVDGIVGTGVAVRLKRLFLKRALQDGAPTEAHFGPPSADGFTRTGRPRLSL